MYNSDPINRAMEQLGWKYVDVAAKTRLSIDTVRSICNGEPNIRLASLTAVADALGLTMAELFTPAPDSDHVAEVAA